MWYGIYIFIQCTWGIIQTAAGLIVFFCNSRSAHTFYHGCILTAWDKPGGISLGLFIFAAKDGEDGSDKKMAVHEYGHTIQSLILGPLYLPIVGVISFVWCNLSYFQKLRLKKHLPYTYCFVEKWADTLGERILKEKAIIS